MRLIYLLALLVVVVAVVGCTNIIPKPCAKENQHITVGTQTSDCKCCAGLRAAAPQGFTGGAWCVKPNCEVRCLNEFDVLAEIKGLSAEGIYSKCHNIDIDTYMLLKPFDCPSDKEEQCESVGGVWVERQIGGTLNLGVTTASQCTAVYGGSCGGPRIISSFTIGRCDDGSECWLPDIFVPTCLKGYKTNVLEFESRCRSSGGTGLHTPSGAGSPLYDFYECWCPCLNCADRNELANKVVFIDIKNVDWEGCPQ